MAATGQQGARGKIWAVVGLIEKHGDGFLRADLLKLGHRYDSIGQPDGLSWEDLHAFLVHADHTTATYFTIQGHNWSEAMLLAWIQTTQLGVSNYYGAAAAGVRRPKKPQPYPLPAALRPKEKSDTETTGKARPIQEIDDWLLRKNGR